MGQKQDDTPAVGAAGSGRSRPETGGKDERTTRLEQALRANLRRRKAQSRARAAPEVSGDDPGGAE